MATAGTDGHGAGLSGAPESGIDLRYIDASVRPQDDPYRHLHGRWLDDFELPADESSHSTFMRVHEATQAQLRRVVEDLGTPDAALETRKLADLYASFIDEARLEELGVKPLDPEFAAIDAMSERRGLAALIAVCHAAGVDAPFALEVDADPQDSARHVVLASQSGLGLPDRDYYLQEDGAMQGLRACYHSHIETMFRLAGDAAPRAAADAILKLEKALAALHRTRVQNRDVQQTYNKMDFAELARAMPHFDWGDYLERSGIAGKIDHLVVRQPSYFVGLSALLGTIPLQDWRCYFKWRQLSCAAPYLSKAIVDERFAFSGTTLRGIPRNAPRWKLGIALLDHALGELLGKHYVERHFPSQHKHRMLALVADLLQACRREVDTLDWMGAETQRGARAKLGKLTVKIGYPDRWTDYAALAIAPDDLFGNVRRAAEFEHRRSIGKLGRPVDRSEWIMTPQTVNACYNPVMNELTFPAAILQPPFFNAGADDAVNYGAIGAIIGHEVSHGFDDQGSHYDADGNLREWVTRADRAAFRVKTQALVAQYARYEPLSGRRVDGELTLGENIGDISGLALAFKAYRLALRGGTAAVIDGLTGEQRFYFGWLQVWRDKVREAEAAALLKIDVHAPPAVRGVATLRNQSGFHAAFAVAPNDRMYLPPEERVVIW